MTPAPGDEAPAPSAHLDEVARLDATIASLRAARLELAARRADLDARPVPTPRTDPDEDEDPSSWYSEYREMKAGQRRHWRETKRAARQSEIVDTGG